MAADETAQERKLRLTHEAQQGRDAEELLDKFGNRWLEAAGKRALQRLANAKPEELTTIQADYRAAVSLYGTLKAAVNKGDRAAETLHKEATQNG